MTERVHQIQRKAAGPARPARPDLERPAEELAYHRALQRQTARPVTAQRQAVAPVLRAAALEGQETDRLTSARTQLQRQVETLGALSAAPRSAPTAVPAAPTTPLDWVTVMRARAEGAEGQRLDVRAYGEFQALQRQVAHTLAQGFRQDRGDSAARYATYGTHLATLQRHPVSAPVSRVVLGLVPSSERLPLQRAADEALQRLQAQEQAALNVETAHSLQRQLAELDAEATQPVLQRIQARRGGGAPLPEAVQRHLEQGLNHDLSRVRIHDDAEADKLAKGVNAIAFTTGTDIFFQSGQFQPNTQSGLELLAHEVTHTVQQSQGRVGTGIDPDAGLEAEARTMGARLAQKTTLPTRAIQPRPHSTVTPTTTFQRRPAAGTAPVRTPTPQSVGRVGIITHSDGANLRTQPDAQASKVLPRPLPVGTKVGVISQAANGWSRVSLPSGQSGWLQTLRVTTNLPDPGSRLIRVAQQTTAIGVAERYYRALVRPGQDLRYYVNVLEQVNRQRGTGAFQAGQTLQAGSLLWVPGAAYAQTLAGTVQSGSITGGALARVNAAMGQSPGANIMRSVLESPQYVREVLGDAWATVKEHWPVILATTTALIGAELLVGVLAAAPEPTTVTKFLAVGLQGIITAVAGVGAVTAGAAALEAGARWLKTAWSSRGNATQIKVAAKAFLTMIGQTVMAVASAAGVRASAGRTTALRGLYTREQLVAQIGNKATYEVLMDVLAARGVKTNNAQLLGNLLKKVPDPLELKGFLRKVDKPSEFLATLNKYPLNRVRQVLAEIDSQSIPPQFASRLLTLNLENPVPTRPLNAARVALLNQKVPGGAADKTFGGKSVVLREELTPAQAAQDKAAGARYQALLDDILERSPYVYRYTTRFALNKVRENGWDIREAFMTNVLVKNPNDVSLGAQLKPAWYQFSDGNPDVVVKIPRRLLKASTVPRPSGNTAEVAGWEFTTSAYPEAGKGGLLQFMGTLDNGVLESGIKTGEIEIIELSGGTSRLPRPR